MAQSNNMVEITVMNNKNTDIDQNPFHFKVCAVIMFTEWLE